MTKKNEIVRNHDIKNKTRTTKDLVANWDDGENLKLKST